MQDPREQARAILGLNDLPVEKATPEKIEEALVIASVAVLDAHEERDHWRAAYGVIQNEMKFLLATFMRKGCRAGQRKLIVSIKDVQDLDAGWEVHVDNPEPGIRTYMLKRCAVKKEKSLIARVDNGPH